MRPNLRVPPLLAAFFTAAAVLAGVFELDSIERDRLAQHNRAEALDRLSIVRSKIENAVNARLFLNRGLMAYVSTHPGITTPEFQAFADALVRQQPGVRSIQLAKDSIVSHIYPMEGNRAALGLKLLQLPKQREAVARAIESRNTVVAGPVDLVQGGTAFISRTPIFLARSGNIQSNGTYWGLATIILDKDTLFKAAGLTRESANFDFALRGTDGTGPDGAVFWGNPALFETDSVKLDVSLPNGSWQLAAQPRNGWGTPGSRWLREGGALLALVAGTLAWFLARNPAALRQKVQEATRDLKKSEAHFRSLLENASNFVIFRLAVNPGTPVGAEVLLISPSVHDIMGLPNPYNLASWFDHFDPEDIGWITAAKNRSLANGENFSAQMRWFHPKRQTWVWLSMLVTPVTDTEGSITHFNGIIQNITAQKLGEDLQQRAYDTLEDQVEDRTIELRMANERLKAEIFEREYAEKTLRAQRDLYYALIKAQSDIGESVLIIENWQITFANEASCRQFGYTLDELKALPAFIQLVHPDDHEHILGNHRRRLAGEQFKSRYEIGIVTRDRQRRDAEIAVSVIHNSNPLRIVVVVQDITERKRMSDALQSQLLFTRALFEAIPNPVFFKNKEGKYLGCNQAFEEAFGLSRQEIEGKTVYDIMPEDLADIYHAMDLALFQESGRQVYESQVGLADGTRRDVIFNKATFSDASGELSGLVGVILDITERKQMEKALRSARDKLEERVRKRTLELARINEELKSEINHRKQAEEGLRESEARFRATFDASSDCIVVVNPDYICLYANQTTIRHTVQDREKIVGHNLLQVLIDTYPRAISDSTSQASPAYLTPDGVAAYWKQEIDRVFAMGETRHLENCAPFDGKLIYSETAMFPIRDADGNLFAVGIFDHDVTERKQAENILRRQAQIIDQIHDSVIAT
ncbi:MAG: PAS domain S-box protein, partial [Betaproteobacteria bacterium]